MRQRFTDSIRQYAGRAVIATLAVGLLAGCGYRAAEYTPVAEIGPWSEIDPTGMERKLALSDFSVELVRFVDSRRPQSREARIPDRIIYEYEPDELMQGVSYRFPVLVEKYACYRPKMAKEYKLEVELKRLQTVIKTGTLLTGSYGRYNVNMEIAVLVRRADSTPVLQKHYRYEIETRRKAYDERSPSKELDRAKMYELVEQGIRQMSANMSWDLYTEDAPHWKVEPRKPMVKAAETPAVIPASPVEELAIPEAPSPTEVDESGFPRG